MIQLRLLGGLALTGPDGRELPAVLRQPKRLALLAYLAVATPRGFHRRDTLLALFWPERDTDHARAALSHSLYTVRRALGDGVIVNRGDEEVGLAPEAGWCDAVAFEEAANAGRPGEAVALYRGDLLAGFHLSGAPQFERWLEEERTRLRAHAAESAARLVDEERARGRLPEAVRWARWAVGLSPYHEPGVRRLMELLDKAGDRAGAVYEYELFARRLSADLELEPSPETVALAEGLRAREGAVPGPRAGPRAPRWPATPPQPPPGVAAPTRPRLTPRRVALGLLALGAIAAAVGSLRPAPAVADSPTTVAVFPFSYRGSPEFGYLAHGMADLLSTRFDGTAGLRGIDSRSIFMSLSRDSVADPARGRVAAERFGAGLFVLGSIVEAGGRLQVSATLYETRGRLRSSAEAMASGEAEIFGLADSLARRMLAETQDEPLHLARVAGEATLSLPALKAYLEGERELRAGRAATAQEAFRRATGLDTSFALAYYRLGSLSEPAEAGRALDQALRHGNRLAQHHRWLVEAAAALLRGDHTLADQRVRQTLTVRPDFAEAWAMSAGLTLQKGHLLGRAWVDAREAFERGHALDPRDAFSLWWLSAIAAREGRRTDLEALTDRLLGLDPAPWLAGNARGQRAIVLGDTAGEARFVADLRTRPDPWAQSSAGVVTWTTGDLSAGRRLWRLITEPSRSRGMRVLARVTLAKIELTNGRTRSAQAELDALEALDPGSALEHRAFFALTRFQQAPRTELMALRATLEGWDPSRVPVVGDGLLATHAALHPYLRHYLLGLLSARLGDAEAALRHAVELEQGDRSSPSALFAADQAKVVRAEVAMLQGRPGEALAILEQARFWTMGTGLEDEGDSPFLHHLHERFARAELLYQMGRLDEALPWYRALAYDLLYTAPAHLRLAQIQERRRDPRRAAEHYSRFIDLWGDGDPSLQPMVQRARGALAKLR